jgi:hypothetical protein
MEYRFDVDEPKPSELDLGMKVELGLVEVFH